MNRQAPTGIEVLIVGAGLAGLYFAIECHRQGHSVFVLESRDKYRGCWVLMDRDDRADDNAEHLYRHLMRQGKTGNVWFVLPPFAKITWFGSKRA